MDDDFSDSELAAQILASGGGAAHDDEQHAQKVNGQVELLLAKNKELSRELKAEKAHVQKLSHDLSIARLELGQAPNASGLGGHGSSSLGSTYLSDELKHEMVEYSALLKEHDGSVAAVHNAGEATDAACIAILKASAKMLKEATAGGKKPASRGTTSGTRGGTASKAEQENQLLLVRIKDLEVELKLALGAAEDIRALKAKLMQLVERCRVEKEAKIKADADLALTTKKMNMLADHLEKLMVHLKHEAAAKIRAMEQLRVADKDYAKLKEKSELISRKSSAKDRLVLELREGCKILEDQLRLMDEKYLELRTKLDWARENSEKKVRTAVAKAKELRVKFALLGNTMPLDKVPLPDIHGGGGGYSNTSVTSVSYEYESLGSQSLQGRMGRSGGVGDRPGRKMSNTSQSLTSLERAAEPDLDTVLEKIRKKTGGKVDWDDEKLRTLAKSR